MAKPLKAETLKAPFPWFGGKRTITDLVWRALGSPKQYIEPFCGSAAVLLASPTVAPLEVIGDVNGFVANFWRCVRYNPGALAREADYPVSHVDLGVRHKWLLERVPYLAEMLQDPEWPGDARCAGWWMWGQCSWIGSGWCEWHVSSAGRGVQARGKIPHVGNAGTGVQARGQIPHVGNAGRGAQARGQIPHVGNAGRGAGGSVTSSTVAVQEWVDRLAERLARVRVIHGDWTRCLNSHYGGEGDRTAVFFDPPYRGYEWLYSGGQHLVADDVAEWCRANAGRRIALCGHAGDYDLPGWECVRWDRKRLTYSGSGTKSLEAVWFSPSCAPTGELRTKAMSPEMQALEALL
jgi:DNA adenine methylase